MTGLAVGEVPLVTGGMTGYCEIPPPGRDGREGTGDIRLNMGSSLVLLSPEEKQWPARSWQGAPVLPCSSMSHPQKFATSSTSFSSSLSGMSFSCLFTASCQDTPPLCF